MREPNEETKCRHSRQMSVLGKVFMVIGILTVVYLFITEVLMRFLALLTP
jgi:hypothetical protein